MKRLTETAVEGKAVGTVPGHGESVGKVLLLVKLQQRDDLLVQDMFYRNVRSAISVQAVVSADTYVGTWSW